MAKVGPGKMLVSLYLDSDIVKRVDRLAAAKDMSRSKYCERVLVESLSEDEAVVQAFNNPILLNAFAQAFMNPEVARALLHTMRSDLDDKQMVLFQDAMVGVIDQMNRKLAPVGRGDRRQAKKAAKRTVKKAARKDRRADQ